jgi:DNA-binding MarR family transcriptional regulator
MMPDNLDNDLLVLINDVARHIRTYGNQLAQAHGITQVQLLILARLSRQPDLSQIELAEIAEVAPITIARVIDRLEERGLVKRCSDPRDRRIWRLQLTPAAAPILSELKNFRTKLHRVLTREINPALLSAMTKGLRQMKENVSSELLTND